MAQILDGKVVRDKIKEGLKEKIKKLGFSPCLAIIQAGDREDSNVYIRQKVKFGEEIGVKIKYLKMEKRKNGKIEEEIIKEIKKLNQDEKVNGIIVQLPLPDEIDAGKILKLIKKEKDPEPATARAVIEILNYYDIPVKNKKICVIGQGIIAGKPIAEELEKIGAQVIKCDINTKNIQRVAKESDILVSAVGKAGLITKEFVSEKQAIVDVGFSIVGGKIMGDVASIEVEPIVRALTPVPGGVGPVTVACLFENLLDLI